MEIAHPVKSRSSRVVSTHMPRKPPFSRQATEGCNRGKLGAICLGFYSRITLVPGPELPTGRSLARRVHSGVPGDARTRARTTTYVHLYGNFHRLHAFLRFDSVREGPHGHAGASSSRDGREESGGPCMLGICFRDRSVRQQHHYSTYKDGNLL